MNPNIARPLNTVKDVLRIPLYGWMARISGVVYGLIFVFASGTIFLANGGEFPADPFFLPYIDSRLGPGLVWLVTRTLLISVTATNALTISALSVLVGVNVALAGYKLRISQRSVQVFRGVVPSAFLGLFATASCCVPSAATLLVGVGLVGVGNFFYKYYHATAMISVALLLVTAYLATRQISKCKPVCPP